MSKRTREEQIIFCKEQAWKQYEYDISGKEFSNPDKAYINACTTMLCDLNKNPETASAAKSCAFLIFMVDSYESMKRFIDGFN